MTFARRAAGTLLALAAIAVVVLPAAPCVPRHGAVGVLAAGIDRAGALVCHRRPDRSLVSCGTQWPVCGRCSGLYLGAGIAAWSALVLPSLRRRHAWWRRVLLVAAAPTAALWLAEAIVHAPVGNLARLVAALPLGMAGAAWLRAIAAGDLR